MGLKPFHALPIHPFSMTFLSTLFLWIYKDTDSVLPVISPASYIHGPVGPGESALSIFLAVLEITLIPSAVIPCFYTSTLDCPEAEFTIIELIYISKIVLAMTLELTVHEFTFIVAAVSPFEATLSLFLSFIELADIACTSPVIPGLLPDTMLGIIQPLTSVANPLRCIEEGASTSRFVVSPLSNVNVSACLDHFPPAVELAVAEHPFVFSAIRIEQDTEAISLLRCLLSPTHILSLQYLTYHYPLYLIPVSSILWK